MLVLDGSGAKPLTNNYGAAALVDFADPAVRNYQIDLAKEAVKLGFDEILYDYRCPRPLHRAVKAMASVPGYDPNSLQGLQGPQAAGKAELGRPDRQPCHTERLSARARR